MSSHDLDPPDPARPSRRGLLFALGGLAGIGAGAGLRPLFAARAATHLRPPGARTEAALLAACIRCGRCALACPFDCIALGGSAGDRLLGLLGGLLDEGTPRIDAREAPCELCQGYDELQCVAACPTDALSAVDDWESIEMGIARIDESTCLAYLGTICRACWHACPFPEQAITLAAMARPEVVADACIGCGLCVRACLTDPTSIEVVPFAEPAAMIAAREADRARLPERSDPWSRRPAADSRSSGDGASSDESSTNGSSTGDGGANTNDSNTNDSNTNDSNTNDSKAIDSNANGSNAMNSNRNGSNASTSRSKEALANAVDASRSNRGASKAEDRR